jgi:hypothetical protein
VLGIVPSAPAVGQQQLRDTAIVQVALNGGIGGIAEALENEGRLLLLDQLPDLLDRFRRAAAVVAADQQDLPTVDVPGPPPLRHPGEGRGPCASHRAGGHLDSGSRRNDGLSLARVGLRRPARQRQAARATVAMPMRTCSPPSP